MLVAMTSLHPEFDLVKFVYSPTHINCTDAIGVHRVQMMGPQLVLPARKSEIQSGLTSTQHTVLLAILVVVSTHLFGVLFRLVGRMFEISLVSTNTVANVPASAIKTRQEIEMESAASRA